MKNLNKFSKDGQDRLNSLIFGLFYPAVLGTMFYSLLPFLAEYLNYLLNPCQKNPLFPLLPIQKWKIGISFLIVAHFSLDYIFFFLFKKYSGAFFILALFVVLSVYFAFVFFELKNDDPNFSFAKTSISIAFSYVFFIGWTHHNRDNLNQPYLRVIIYEFFGLSVFLIVGIFFPGAPYVLIITLLLACITFGILGWASVK